MVEKGSTAEFSVFLSLSCTKFAGVVIWRWQYAFTIASCVLKELDYMTAGSQLASNYVQCHDCWELFCFYVSTKLFLYGKMIKRSFCLPLDKPAPNTAWSPSCSQIACSFPDVLEESSEAPDSCLHHWSLKWGLLWISSLVLCS